jgi:hypothetical protein
MYLIDFLFFLRRHGVCRRGFLGDMTGVTGWGEVAAEWGRPPPKDWVVLHLRIEQIEARGWGQARRCLQTGSVTHMGDVTCGLFADGLSGGRSSRELREAFDVSAPVGRQGTLCPRLSFSLPSWRMRGLGRYKWQFPFMVTALLCGFLASTAWTMYVRRRIGQTLLFLVVSWLYGWRYPPPAPFSYFFLAFTSVR